MTELEELKNHIEALEKRVEASDKKIALLEETLSTLGKFKASKEMGEYIERQQNAIRMADMLSSFSDETIDMTVQKASVANIQKQQASINEQIVAAIKKSKTNVVHDGGSSIKYLKYESKGNEITITGCTAFDSVDIVIPDMIDGKHVTKIKHDAFHNCKIKTVTFPQHMELIESCAFQNCSNLKSVYNLSCDIGEEAFSQCYNLNDINFGNGVIYIGTNSFSKCNQINNLSFNEGIIEIGPYAFNKCKLLENITFGDGVINLGEYAFSDCPQIKKVDLAKTNIKILNSSCFNNTSLQCISFPKSLRVIKDNALMNTQLKTLVIPDYIESVDELFTDAKNVAFLGMDTSIIEKHFVLMSTYVWPKLHKSVIYCLPGSKVQKYCQKWNITCRPLSEFPTE